MRNIPGQWSDDFDITHETIAPAPRVSLFSTLARFATSVTVEVFKLPRRLKERFTRPLQIVAVPVFREDGASKRRLVDAGLQPYSPGQSRSTAAARNTPKSWVVSPSPSPPSPSPQPSGSFPANVVEDSPASFLDDLDWSMEDVDSGTPAYIPTPVHKPNVGSPSDIGWLRRKEWLHVPDRKILTPKMRTSPKMGISPKPQSETPTTSMRKQLLKKQLRTARAIPSPSSPLSALSRRHSDAVLAAPIMSDFDVNLGDHVFRKPVPNINAPANAVIANAHYEVGLEAREKRDADARATVARGFPHSADTVDVNLSNQLDANDISSSFDSLRTPSPQVSQQQTITGTIDVDLSDLPDASNISSNFHSLRTSSPQASRKKSVRWASHGRSKIYYVDERVSEMLDSTLESIRSPVPKPKPKDDEDEHDNVENDFVVTFEDPDLDSDASSDFDEDVDGPSMPEPSAEDSAEDSLEELQLSRELLDDLEEDFKNLLAKQPPPPPPPKPLIEPLTDEERDQLNDLAVKSNNGKNKAYPIIPQKISARDFGTLLPYQFDGSPQAWLNDEIVNQYLAVLIKTLNDDCGFTYKKGGPAPPYHAFSSHWFTSINNGIKKVERWAGRVGLGGKQFLDAKIVLFPICDGSHWRLLAVKPKERTIEYLDSLGWDGAKYVTKLREYLQNELKDLYVAEEWEVEVLQRSVRQVNGSDCGVFVVLNALAVLRGDETKKVLACDGMLQARERVAFTMVSGHAKELDY